MRCGISRSPAQRPGWALVVPLTVPLTGVLFGVLLLGALTTTTALAHPFDATYYSSRAALKADSNGLHVLVVVEVPTSLILEEFLTLYGDPTQLDEEANEIFRQRQFEKLAKDLNLRVNKRRLPGSWKPVDSEANGRGTETFFVYFLEFVPDDPETLAAEDRLDVRLDMEVFSRDFIYLSASTTAEDPWSVSSNSADAILDAIDDDLFDPETGRWSVDPRLRRLKILFEKKTDQGPTDEKTTDEKTTDGKHPKATEPPPTGS